MSNYEKTNHDLPGIPPYTMLDAWRGVAALWVVMIHSCMSYISRGNLDLLDNPIFSISIMGALGVVMFFVISGYCIAGAAYNCIRNAKPLSRYALDRSRRIYPPYLAACALTVAFSLGVSLLEKLHLIPVSGIFQLPFHDLAYWVTNLTLTHVPFNKHYLHGMAWSLCYEVAFYVVIGVFIMMARLRRGGSPRRQGAFFLWACTIVTSVSVLWLILSGEKVLFPFGLWPQFGIGACLFAFFASGHITENPIWIRLSIAAAWILALVYAIWFASSTSELGHPSARTQMFTCLIFSVIIAALRNFSEKISRVGMVVIFSRLGVISYSVYLSHVFVVNVFNAVLRRIGLEGNLYIYNFLLQVVISLFGGWLFFMLVERHFITTRQVRSIEPVAGKSATPGPA